MAVSSYEKDGKTLWKVYINLRSRVDPKIRRQKLIVALKSEKEALVAEKKLLRELTAEIAHLEGRGVTWDTVIDRWEAAMVSEIGSRYVKSTIQDYRNILRKWTESWLKRPCSELNRGDGREVLQLMHLEGKSRKYQKNVKNIVNVLYDWGIEQKLIRGVNESPMKGIKLTVRKEEKPPEILTIEEIRKLLFEAKRLNHPWYPIWAMALLTGMRNGELHALLWSDVDLENRKITLSKSYNTRMKSVKSTKSGFWRTIPISDELKELLVELKSQDADREQVLPRSSDWDKGMQAGILRLFCHAIGIRPVKFHTLRACFATQLLAHDIAPARVMKICGWRDLKTMQRYVRMAGIDERGATQVLKVLPSDEALMGEVVKLFDFKSKGD